MPKRNFAGGYIPDSESAVSNCLCNIAKCEIKKNTYIVHAQILHYFVLHYKIKSMKVILEADQLLTQVSVDCEVCAYYSIGQLYPQLSSICL